MKQLTAVLFFLFSITASAQLVPQQQEQTPNQHLNLSFDKLDTSGRIIGCSYAWAKDGYYTYKDDSVKIDGNNSIRIQNETTGTEGKFASVTFSLPANFTAKTVTLKGYIKTENVNNGYAGLWLRSDMKSSVADFKNLGTDAPKGTTDWKVFSVSVKMDKDVTMIFFGGLLAGSGKAWFDKFELYADELPIEKVVWQPLKAEQNIVKSNVHLDSLLTKQQVKSLYVLSKIWGFLKYHHPEVAKGKVDFDDELFKIMMPVANAPSKERLNEVLLDWLNSIGNENDYPVAKAIKSNDVYIKPDLSWLSNKDLFGEALIDKLNNIYSHRNSSKNAYVKLMPNVLNPNFDGEEKYSSMDAADDGMRMLALFRYWNIVEYFYPSKYLIKKKWDDVLMDYIPFLAAQRSTLGYKLTCLKLISEIHDTHASISGDRDLGNYFGVNYSAVNVQVIDERVIVTSLRDGADSRSDSLQTGDEILTVNGKTIKQRRAELEPYIGASNKAAADRNFASAFLLRSKDETMDITFGHEGQTKSAKLKLYPQQVLYSMSGKKDQEESYRLLNDSIGYVTLATAKIKELKTMFKMFADTKGIIIDIRNYPMEFMPFAMADYIKPAPSGFVKFTNGNIDNPGLFTFKYTLKNGKNNKDYYKGKIVILVNEKTQSQAEYTTMALQTAPNAIVMGSQTAGADGNVSSVPFPGGFSSYISGIGVFYPDGKDTQGIGIVPDVEVKPTIAAVIKGVDELLEKAKQYINGAN